MNDATADTSESLKNSELATQTIKDFGEQWANYQNNPGYYGSQELLPDFFGPLLEVEKLKGKNVAEIGSGTGRIVNMLLNAGVSHITAIEPASGAFSVLQKNTNARKEKITYLKLSGDKIPPNNNLDYLFSIGVIHHIPNPEPVIRAAHKSLRSGGKIFIWLYGREGNKAYLSFALPLRKITKHIPHPFLVALTWILSIFLNIYIALCRFAPLPMHVYMREVLANFDHSVRRITIYDQLNPAYAKYYSQKEAEELLSSSGFSEVRSFHRHGYSWSVIGTKE